GRIGNPSYEKAPGSAPMFDELARLRDESPLFDLLAHYAGLAAPDRQAWHPRRPPADAIDSKSHARLHGELIAYGWLEQNTGTVPDCYRATREGLRAVKHSHEATE